MKAVLLNDHLILLKDPAVCSLCAKPAHWQLHSVAYCSRCYLDDVSGLRKSEAFRTLEATVLGDEHKATDSELDHLLAVVVLENRMFNRDMNNDRRSPGDPRQDQ